MKSTNKKVYLVVKGDDYGTETFNIAAYSSKQQAYKVVDSYIDLKMLGAVDSLTWCDVVDIPFYDDPAGEVEV